MKNKLIQLLLVERLLCGQLLIQAKKLIEEQGREPVPGMVAEINMAAGRIEAALWALRELDPVNFASTLDVIGFRVTDQEVTALRSIDERIERVRPLIGDIAAIANETREEQEGGK